MLEIFSLRVTKQELWIVCFNILTSCGNRSTFHMYFAEERERRKRGVCANQVSALCVAEIATHIISIAEKEK